MWRKRVLKHEGKGESVQEGNCLNSRKRSFASFHCVEGLLH